ncbi:NAD(P)-dependent oxidoreductase, partial [Rhizobium sp. NZLR3b]|uniref:NAD(P)-dependent oxidoreductase n=1 Tax=Rhizobium sp. NZLR3b TaxID=2731101 RepID=UPI002180D8CD
MSNKPVIGFIGVGMMGHGMAKNIRTKGYELWFLDQRPMPTLLEIGAKSAASPKDMAEKCDIIHICLQNSGQVEKVVKGNDGIIAGARAGLIVIDTSTSDPSSTLLLALELEAAGATLIDASLGRTPKEAEEGTLDAMVAGDDDVFERVKPVIECWAGRIIRGFCRKFLARSQNQLTLDTPTQRVKRIAEMAIGHWVKIGPCGS